MVTAAGEGERGSTDRGGWSVPAAVFVLLAAVTTYVSWRQVELHRALLARHTEDVCLQASRRLTVFVDSRLRVAEIFAERWATHESRDFSRRRFVEFGSVVRGVMQGYAAIALVSQDRGTTWVVPRSGSLGGGPAEAELESFLDLADERGETTLSPPFRFGAGETGFYAALPLRRGEERLGTLVVRFGADALIDDCFAERIRREFAFEIDDGDELLYRYPAGAPSLAEGSAPGRASERFAVRNREWSLAMAPRSARASASGWPSALPFLGLGLLLSLGLATLARVALRRLALYRKARDDAFVAAAAEKEAREELAGSEARYRSVFDSATDGLIVMDREGTILEANPAACAMHGRGPGELEGDRFEELIAPARREHWDEIVRQLDDDGTVTILSEHVTREGRAIDVEVRGSTFSHGGSERVLVILTDVTELKRSERRSRALSRKVLVAQEEERARISRELHDELGQILTAARFELGWIGKRLESGGEKPGASLSTVIPLVEKAADELRRLCKGLRPPLLDDLGLEPAAGLLVEEFQERSGIAVDLHVELDEADEALPMEASLAAYRVLQESLTNAARHGKAKNVEITLWRKRGELLVSVYDDGKGFDAKEVDEMASSGIAGMRERAFLVGGTVEISSAPFQGTRVALRVPLGGSSSREEVE